MIIPMVMAIALTITGPISGQPVKTLKNSMSEAYDRNSVSSGRGANKTPKRIERAPGENLVCGRVVCISPDALTVERTVISLPSKRTLYDSNGLQTSFAGLRVGDYVAVRISSCETMIQRISREEANANRTNDAR